MAHRLFALLLLLVGFLPAGHAGATPRVAVSIPPIHSLVAGVMAGVAEPTLIVKGGASPHTYALRPSGMRTLYDADAIFWVDERVSPFLAKPLSTLRGQTRLVRLLDLPGLTRLPARRGGAWEGGHDHDDPGHAHAEDGHDGEVDPHIWLDPENARHIVTAVAGTLAELDPANADRYLANAKAMDRRLAALDQELARRLAPVADTPYLVFHDAYQYLERRYGLHAVGALTVSPDRRPGARRLTEIRDRIEDLDVRCVFREPQFPPKLVETIIEGSDVRVGVLDPLGAELKAGATLYPQLLRGMAAALAGCLGG